MSLYSRFDGIAHALRLTICLQLPSPQLLIYPPCTELIRSCCSSTFQGTKTSPTPYDNMLIVEEPSYTIVPKSDDSTDIDLEWTDVGAEDRVRAREKVEE
ncbi:hypothetical protein M378DRAFT_172014 [Amanita muscaria Koide BX008]|uniref:Uncharacterized protein n=1 Tax=Amanita muscaria (strain Koide BX008) TaxID=946122 RepID=A0A0C2W7S0_AMAMK|nr:hypothetical protein M378DRAFT_172014 [Amanita muscaria Koide BX008]